MTTTLTYLKEWQKAIQIEIQHLKKHGSSKYMVKNGRLVSNRDGFTYYFETDFSVRVPVGGAVRVEWGSSKNNGRILSSEGKNIMLTLEHSIGDFVSNAYLFHDPWELLEKLILRLDEIKQNKRKRLRIKKLMDPSMPVKHPAEKSKSNLHELFLRSKYNPVTYVWGPPGTGKTYTLARTAANHYFKDKKVLILSHSNQAVDVLIGEIASFISKKDRFREGDVIRYGSQSSESISKFESLTTTQLIEKEDPTLAKTKNQLMEERRNIKKDLTWSYSKRDSDYLLELETKIARILEKFRKKEIQYLKDSKLIGTTLAKAASDSSIYEKEYDVVILDEASMAYIPQVAFAASLGTHVIICGDFKQLPPIASSRHSLVDSWLKEDIFHASRVVDWEKEGKLHPHLLLLNEQRRMHPDISAFTNKFIYRSLVGDHESVHKSRNQIVELTPFPKRASVLVDTSNTGNHCLTEPASNSRVNIWQLLQSFQLIHEAYLAGARSIGYVTPYRAQAAMMELLLTSLYEQERNESDLIAATVHRFQGSERDVIIFDSVDSYPKERAGFLLTGKESERLINVAITRTKGKFIHVGDTAFIKDKVYRNKTIRQLVDHQLVSGQTVLPQDIGTWVKNQHPQLKWMHAKKLDTVFTDIQTAASSIILSFPGQSGLTKEWSEQINRRQKNVSLTIFSERPLLGIDADHWVQANIEFPFVILDGRVLWLGLPLEGMIGAAPPYVAVRLDCGPVTQQIIAMINGKK